MIKKNDLNAPTSRPFFSQTDKQFGVSTSTTNNVSGIKHGFFLQQHEFTIEHLSCLALKVLITNLREKIMGLKCVRVVTYPRFRLGKWEQVCTHLRSLPST